MISYEIRDLRDLLDIGDCGLLRAIEAMKTSYINRVAELISCEASALEWYAHECMFGRKPMGCVHKDGREVLVKDLETFIETLDW
jgi:hypothetical protein